MLSDLEKITRRNKMIWNNEMECADRQQMHEIQSRRLTAMIQRIYDNVPFYRKKLKEAGIEPGDIRSVDQLSDLPFTTKNDLRDNYPFGLFTVPQSDVVRIHASSGTTGKPTVVGYTQHGPRWWRAASPWQAYTAATPSRSPMAMVRLPGDWDCITEQRKWALP